MKQRYHLFRRENGIYYSFDPLTKKRQSLETADTEAAQRLAKAAGFRYAGFGITEVIPHPVLCRMSVGSAFETFRLSVWVRHKNGRH